jgi:hypothetical protein
MFRQLAGELADAFYDDPISGWLMPDEHTRPARLQRFYTIELRHVGLTRGHAWTSNELLGAAISAPPGAWRELRVAGSPPLRLMVRPPTPAEGAP